MINLSARHLANASLWEKLRSADSPFESHDASDGPKVLLESDAIEIDPLAPFHALPQLALTFDVETGLWKTTQRAIVWIELLGKKILIPQGFEFDLASVPRWAWNLIAPFELGRVAPLVHDWLYQHDGKLTTITGGAGLGIEDTDEELGEITVNRKQADQIFRELMRREGVSAWRRTAAYGAVRIGGPRW